MKQSFLKNTTYLYASNFADYLLTIFFLPFIARIIGVVELGKIGLAQTFGILIILIMEFGSPIIAVQKVARTRDSKKNLKEYINQIFTLKILLIPIVFLITFSLMLLIPVFKLNILYLYLVLIGAIFQGMTPIWFFQGIEEMKVLALSKIFFRLIGFIVIVCFIDSPEDGWIVLSSFSISSLFIFLYLYYKMIKRVGATKFVSPSKLVSLIKSSKNSFLLSLIPVCYNNISILFLSIAVNPVQLGIFYGANRIYKAFNSLFGPLSQSIFPIISYASKKNNSFKKIILKKYLPIIFSIGIIFFTINYFFSEPIVLFLLGDDFINSSSLLKIFSIVLPLTAISNAIGRQWLIALNKDSFYLIIQLFSSFFGFFIFFIGLDKYESASFPLSLIAYECFSIAMILSIIIYSDEK